MKNPSGRRVRWKAVTLLVFVVLIAVLYLVRERIYEAAGRALVEDDGAQHADCILVLGGDDFGQRILRAGKLIREDYAPYALVDGPGSLMGHESDVTIRYAAEHGFPAEMFRAVWLPAGVDSTATEVDYVANKILRPNHVRKILLVTSNYHTRRAARFMRRRVPWLEVAVIPAPDPFFSVDGWWRVRNGKKTFLLEWTKTIAEWGD